MKPLIAAKVNIAKLWFEELSEESSAYLLSFFALLVIFVSNGILGEKGSTGFYFIPLIVLLYGFYVYIIKVYRIVWESWVGKALISSVFFAASSWSLAVAKIAINSSTQVTSVPFTNTISITALLLAPFVMSIIFGFLGLFFLPFAMILFLNDDENYTVKRITTFWKFKQSGLGNIGKWLVRIAALVILISLSWQFNGANGWYATKVENFAKWYAYNFDTEIFSHCKVEDTQRVAYIDSNNIIVASNIEGVYKFKVSKCIVAK